MAAQGKWIWREDSTEKLEFQSCQRRRKLPLKSADTILPIPTTNKLQSDKKVTLEDLKAVAIHQVSDELLEKMTERAADLFDQCYRTDQMNSLLWTSLIYYNAFQQYRDASNNENLSISGALGDKARETLRITTEQLHESKANVGRAYSHFILGLEHSDSHHCKGGRSRVSQTHADQYFYEVLYEFIKITVWICFGYNNWKMIHGEMGRLFRTNAFNKDCKLIDAAAADGSVEVESIGLISKDSSEYISYRIYYDRPAVGLLKTLRSPALVNLLPSSKEKSQHLFEQTHFRDENKSKKVYFPQEESPPKKLGIIGEKISDYDPKSLKLLRKLDEEDTSDTDTDSDDSNNDADQDY